MAPYPTLPLLVVFIAYLLGSLSFSVIMVYLLEGLDIRDQGSGNAGATNVLRTVGRRPAMAVLLLDIGKGALAVGLARWLEVPEPWVGAAAVAAVAGHIFPAFHRLRGGKGVATVTGALGCLDPLPALVAAAVFGLVVLTTRYVSLGSIVATAVFPLFAWLAGRFGWTPPAPAWLLISASLVACLILFRHRSNVRRLWDGTENRLTPRRRQGEIQ